MQVLTARTAMNYNRFWVECYTTHKTQAQHILGRIVLASQGAFSQQKTPLNCDGMDHYNCL